MAARMALSISDKELSMARFTPQPPAPFRGDWIPHQNERFLTVTRDTGGFGFSLKGSNPVSILAVTPDGAAERSGLQPGDQLLSINSLNVADQNHHAVVNIIQQAGDTLHVRVRSGSDDDSRGSSPVKKSLSLGSGVGAGPAMAQGMGVGALLQELDASDDETAETASRFNDPVAQLQEDERIAFEPFGDLEGMLRRLPHTAVFLSYLMSNGKHENEMFLLLHIQWLRQQPDHEEAMAMFEDFLATNAPMKVDSVSAPVYQELEAALNDRAAEAHRFVTAYAKVRACVVEPLAQELAQFHDTITNRGMGSLYRATMLVELVQAEEVGVIEEILRPLLESSQRDIGDPPRSSVIVSSLLQFMSRAGVDVSKYVSRDPRRASEVAAAAASRQHNYRLQRSDSMGSRKKKIHLYAGHHFMTVNYNQPTFCGVCKTLLWGVMRQGWNCQDCGFNVHKSNDITGHRKCHETIDVQCPGKKMTPKKSIKKFIGRSSVVRLDSNPSADDLSAKAKFPRHASLSGGELGRETDDVPSAGPLPSSQSTSSLRSPERGPPPSPPGSPTASFRKRQAQATGSTDELAAKLPYDLTKDPLLWSERPASKSVAKSIGKAEAKRQECIYELVQTEKGFVCHLAIIEEFFRKPLVDESLLRPEELHTIFNNLTEITKMNTAFCQTLVQVVKETDAMALSFGPVFLEAFSKLNAYAYADFCANQTNAIAFYRERRRVDPNFNARMATSESHPACERLTLVEFLVKPLQRLTKYPLLLKDILKNTDKADKAETDALAQALTSAEAVLRHVQEAVKESEDRARLREIHDKIEKVGLEPHDDATLRDLYLGRKLVMEGPLQIRVQEKQIDVHAILLSDLMLLTQPKDGRLVVKGIGRDAKKRSPVLRIGLLMVRPVATDSKGFFLIVDHRSKSSSQAAPQMFECATNTRATAKDWMDRVAKATEEFKRNNPNWEKQYTEETESFAAFAEKSEEDSLDVKLGKLIERMRDNCDTNAQLLTQVLTFIDPDDAHRSPLVTQNSIKARSRFNRKAQRRATSRHKLRDDEESSVASEPLGREPTSHSLVVPPLKHASSLQRESSGSLGHGSAGSLHRDPSFRRSDDDESSVSSVYAENVEPLQQDEDRTDTLEWLSQQLATAHNDVTRLTVEVAELRLQLSAAKKAASQAPVVAAAAECSDDEGSLALPAPAHSGHSDPASSSSSSTLPTHHLQAAAYTPSPLLVSSPASAFAAPPALVLTRGSASSLGSSRAVPAGAEGDLAPPPLSAVSSSVELTRVLMGAQAPALTTTHPPPPLPASAMRSPPQMPPRTLRSPPPLPPAGYVGPPTSFTPGFGAAMVAPLGYSPTQVPRPLLRSRSPRRLATTRDSSIFGSASAAHAVQLELETQESFI
eukprot:m.82548 g.82548  ORF g.82548 m.82548 type:complete len:1388 (-) comp13411_c1_seq2:448-4611(-)